MSELSITSVLGSSMPRIKVVAVGAASTGAPEVYTKLLLQGYAELVAFEPNQEECKRLNERSLNEPTTFGKSTYLPFAVGDGSEATLYITNYGLTSSLFEPNHQLLTQFHDLDDLYQVISKQKVNTVRLDDLKEISDADWLVMDTQGSELNIIKGAKHLLDETIIIVQTEVLFIPHYVGQPLFSDIDIALREHDFYIHSMFGVSCPIMKSFPKSLTSQRTQASWTDLIYVKNFLQLEKLSPRKRLALAIILHEAYGSYDLCSHVLKTHDQIEGTCFYDIYISKL